MLSLLRQETLHFAHPLVTSMVSIILLSVTFSLKPVEAMLFIMVKACPTTNIQIKTYIKKERLF